MHFTMATIIPIAIAGINNRPIPKGIKAIITTKPTITLIIVNNTFNNITPTVSAAKIKTINTNKPNIISISFPFLRKFLENPL